MFMKSIITAFVLSTASLQVYAHADIEPVLNKGDASSRANVLRPSTAQPCGTANLAGIDTSVAVPIVNGVVTLKVTDFNAGADGSRSLKSAEVNADGKGTAFVAAKVVTNGNANPTAVGSDTVTIAVTGAMTGGAAGNRGLLAATTTAGFGNCVVITSGETGAVAGKATAGATGAVAGGAAGGATAGATGGATTTAGAAAAAAKNGQGKGANRGKQGGRSPRNARSLVDNVSRNMRAVRRWVSPA